MIPHILIPFLLFSQVSPSVIAGSAPATEDSIQYQSALSFDVIGKYHDEDHYGRFPRRYQATLRESVWNLGQCTAGVGIRFRTNATTIVVRWTVLKGARLPHMPATGVQGVDLYAFVDQEWQYVKTGFPREETTEAILLSEGDGVEREFLLNLPLYDGVKALEIGVNASAKISKARDRHLLSNKPVVYYGTSIAQGGCASRPGLAFTSILSRKLDREFFNFGFSGNGTMETSVGEAMAEIDAALYVIDCNANTKTELIYDRALELVRMLKAKRPDVPVLLVERFLSQSNYLNPEAAVYGTIEKKNEELRRAFADLKKSGTSGLYYRDHKGLMGVDREGTVDGTHPNDLGMMRMADALLPTLKKIL